MPHFSLFWFAAGFVLGPVVLIGSLLWLLDWWSRGWEREEPTCSPVAAPRSSYTSIGVPAFDPAMEYHNYDVVRMSDGVMCRFMDGAFHRIS